MRKKITNSKVVLTCFRLHSRSTWSRSVSLAILPSATSTSDVTLVAPRIESSRLSRVSGCACSTAAGVLSRCCCCCCCDQYSCRTWAMTSGSMADRLIPAGIWKDWAADGAGAAGGGCCCCGLMNSYISNINQSLPPIDLTVRLDCTSCCCALALFSFVLTKEHYPSIQCRSIRKSYL